MSIKQRLTRMAQQQAVFVVQAEFDVEDSMVFEDRLQKVNTVPLAEIIDNELEEPLWQAVNNALKANDKRHGLAVNESTQTFEFTVITENADAAEQIVTAALQQVADNEVIANEYLNERITDFVSAEDFQEMPEAEFDELCNELGKVDITEYHKVLMNTVKLHTVDIIEYRKVLMDTAKLHTV